MTNPVYRTPAWRKLSSRRLAMDGYRCQIRLPGCTGRATTTDHIVELADGGAAIPAIEDVQSACRHCNTAKKNRSQAARARRAARASPPLRQW